MTKIGIFGDIHSNLSALNAVLQKFEEEACDGLVCTGDIVGYGPSPAECVKIIREREIDCVLGNHDHYVTLLMDARLERLRPDVRQAVEWTQAALPMEDLRWLAELPRRLDYEELTIVHGSFGPKPWAYLVNEAALAENFKHQDVPLGFCGHSHVPMLSYNREADAPFIHYFENGPLPDESRVIVNVGAVGQPRDHDPRAACVIYELESRTLHLVRVPYDIAETQELMRQAGLPEKFITRLELGR